MEWQEAGRCGGDGMGHNMDADGDNDDDDDDDGNMIELLTKQ